MQNDLLLLVTAKGDLSKGEDLLKEQLLAELVAKSHPQV